MAQRFALWPCHTHPPQTPHAHRPPPYCTAYSVRVSSPRVCSFEMPCVICLMESGRQVCCAHLFTFWSSSPRRASQTQIRHTVTNPAPKPRAVTLPPLRETLENQPRPRCHASALPHPPRASPTQRAHRTRRARVWAGGSRRRRLRRPTAWAARSRPQTRAAAPWPPAAPWRRRPARAPWSSR